MDQCLDSVVKAIKNVSAEVIIVDNNSVDGSLNMLSKKYPQFKLIANKFNGGFSKANNQAIKEANGEYILLLNPDTVVEEETFSKTIAFMDSHPNSGGLGVHMIDGRGRFLPESKRGLPTPMVAFYKIFGFSSLFPKSKRFGQYHLGHLSQFETNIVDVLSGAFMMMRSSALEKVGLLDEDYFMYGEDVDLSYRIQQAGYKNYYFAESAIIHFKGESTKRGSLNYVKMFYQAMSIFVTKHYKSSTATVFSASIKIAIWIRAIIAIISGLATKWGLIIVDSIIIFSCLRLVEKTWVQYVRDGKHFDDKFLQIFIPGFTILFLLSAALSGIYDNLYKPSKALLASFSAIIILLAVYSLLPEQYRFSRGVILIGGFAAGLAITLVRWFLLQLNWIKETVLPKFNMESKK